MRKMRIFLKYDDGTLNMEMKRITKKRLIDDLRALGLKKGTNLLVSSAISKVGWIDNGIITVLDSLREILGEKGGIFGNAFTRLHRLPLSAKNSRKVFDVDTPAYSGCLINLMLKQPDAMRSRHPGCSVVGIGRDAPAILDQHDAWSPAYKPALRLAETGNGWMLKLGSTYITPGATTVHVVQDLLGFKNSTIGKLGVNYRAADGSIKLFVKNYAGGCSLGFWKFYEHYKKEGALLEGKVGNAHCVLMNLQKTLETDLRILKEDPAFFFCDNPLCYSCRVSWDHSTTPLAAYILRRLTAQVIGKNIVLKLMKRK